MTCGIHPATRRELIGARAICRRRFCVLLACGISWSPAMGNRPIEVGLFCSGESVGP